MSADFFAGVATGLGWGVALGLLGLVVGLWWSHHLGGRAS